jgi:hypothetical protein
MFQKGNTRHKADAQIRKNLATQVPERRHNDYTTTTLVPANRRMEAAIKENEGIVHST